jgi:hypothetical protein
MMVLGRHIPMDENGRYLIWAVNCSDFLEICAGGARGESAHSCSGQEHRQATMGSGPKDPK